MLYHQITGSDGQITDTVGRHRPASGFLSCAQVITLLCGGDLPGLVVDLEEGDVLFVGDLADQGVVQVSVGGRGVVLVHGENADNWRTWDDTRT